MRKNTTLKKLINWEHWPPYMFYIPNLPYAFYLAIKAKHLSFYTATNPCIKNSGIGTESKFETTMLIPEKYRPKTILIKPNTEYNKIITAINKQQIQFPLIAKPDIGFRGLLVQKVHTETELQTYFKKYGMIAIIIQEFLNYENECGVLYFRYPENKTGNITSLTLKKFLAVTGDGKSTLKELILNDERAKLYIELFTEIHQNELNTVPNKDKVVKLTAIGNHSKGTQFINGNHLISKTLIKTFDTLNKKIPGWYYGRIDLKYNSFSSLENGTDFKIIEINGILAEPTHIYDAKKFTYFQALKTIRTHWKSIYKIATVNNKKLNIPYKNTKHFSVEILQLKKHLSHIKKNLKTYL